MQMPQTQGLAVLCRMPGVFSTTIQTLAAAIQLPLHSGICMAIPALASSGSTAPVSVCFSCPGSAFCAASSLLLTQRPQAVPVLHWPGRAGTQGMEFCPIQCWFLGGLGNGLILKGTFALWVCSAGTSGISHDNCSTRVTLWGDTFLFWVTGMVSPHPHLVCKSL